MIGGDSADRVAASLRRRPKAKIEGGVSPRVAPFADLRDLGALLQRAGFALPVTDVDRITVRYASPLGADARSAPHGRDQRAAERRRTPLAARRCCGMAGDLRRALCRCRRPHPRDVRDRLAVGLGAASRASSSRWSRARRKTRLADALAHARRFRPARERRQAGVRRQSGTVSKSCERGEQSTSPCAADACKAARQCRRDRSDVRDAGGDHRIFDRGGAAFVGAGSGASRGRRI